MKQTLLSLHEYMERNGCLLPLSTSALAEAAMACHAYAKALRYKESASLSYPDVYPEPWSDRRKTSFS